MAEENPLANPLAAQAYREASSRRSAELKAQRRDTILRLIAALDYLDRGEVDEAKAVIARQLKALQVSAHKEQIETYETILKAAGRFEPEELADDEAAEFAEIEEQLLSIKSDLAALMRQESHGGATAA